MSKKVETFSHHLRGKVGYLLRLEENLKTILGSPEGKPEALCDVFVIEASYADFAGAFAASLLGEFGAEVVKIEPPGGDPARKITPWGVNVKGYGIPYLIESRNKQIVELNLKSREGLEKFKKLAAKADVLIETYGPGVFDSLGIGYRQLSEFNPGLIYVAISPYGHYSSRAKEFSKMPSTDLTAQAESGFPSLIGDPAEPEPYNYPLKAGIWAAWYMSGALAAAGALIALYYKRTTGEGQMVDIATHDALPVCNGWPIVSAFTSGKPRDRLGMHDWLFPYPYGYFKCKDGYVTIVTMRNEDFRALLKILGRWDLEDDWKYVTDRLTDDLDRINVLARELEKELQKYTRDELAKKAWEWNIKSARDRLRARGFPFVIKGPTFKEVLEENHWKQRGTFMKVNINGKEVIVPAPFSRCTETPPRLKWTLRE